VTEPHSRFKPTRVSCHGTDLGADNVAWELCHRLTREEALHYLDTRASQGFNVILTVLVPELE
jgi:hypothetical protein